MDWIHCNSCFYQPGQVPKRDFKLTSCGHMFCNCCSNSGTIEKCLQCGMKCSSTPLSANMAKEVQLYFEDPESVLRDKVLKVMEFQKNHRQQLNENYRKVCEKYQLAKKSIQALQDEVNLLKGKLAEERRNNSSFSTPTSQPQFPSFGKSSQGQGSRSISGRSPMNNIFTTPARQQYRSQPQQISPSPLSSVSSNSPISVFSRSNASNSPLFKTGLTPPLSSLQLRRPSVTNFRKPSVYAVRRY